MTDLGIFTTIFAVAIALGSGIMTIALKWKVEDLEHRVKRLEGEEE
jgi:uncharacterized membrane protein YciS (DUF1049 family)